jgi:hypothetical protein
MIVYLLQPGDQLMSAFIMSQQGFEGIIFSRSTTPGANT